MKCFILPDAQQDLQYIDNWVTEHFGPQFADDANAGLYNTFDLLADFPQMGRSRPEITAHPLRFFPLRPLLDRLPARNAAAHSRIYHAVRDLSRLDLK